MSAARTPFAVWVLLCATAGSLEALQAGLTSDAIFELARPSDPQIAPNGRQVAFVLESYDPGLDRRLSTIWLGQTTGGRAAEVPGSLWSDRSPRFSPDSHRLAWITQVDGFWEIRVRNLATRTTQSIAASEYPPGSIAWSPSGQQLAFTRRDPEPGLSTGPVELFVVPASGGRVRRIGRGRIARGRLPLATHLEWTPDGRAIVLSLDPNEEDPGDSEIFEIEIGGGMARRLTTRRGPDQDPAISPDGRLVVYTGYDAADGPGGTHRLYLMGRRGSSSPRLIPSTVEGSIRNPIWSPDGRGIYAIIGDERERLALFSLDGSFQILAEHVDPGGGGPAAASFTVSRDLAHPRFSVTTSRPDRPPEVSVNGPRAGGAMHEITMANASLDPRSLGRVEEIQSDSGALGWVLLPPGFQEGRAYSLVVDRRGGSSAPTRRGFDLDRQILAGAGHAVLWMRGLDDNPQPLVDELEARGWIRSDRVFQLGGNPSIRGISRQAPWGDATTPGERKERIEAVLARFGTQESGDPR